MLLFAPPSRRRLELRNPVLRRLWIVADGSPFLLIRILRRPGTRHRELERQPDRCVDRRLNRRWNGLVQDLIHRHWKTPRIGYWGPRTADCLAVLTRLEEYAWAVRGLS